MSFTNIHLYFDDVEVGQEWVSLRRTVTETDIVNFAGISGDFNPIHMDHVFAATTMFRRPIAHGILTLAMGTGLAIMAPPMRTLAFIGMKEWNFLEPVFIGDTIHMRTKILAKEERSRGRRGVVTWQRQIVNQNDKVVQEGITLTLVEGRGGRGGEASANDTKEQQGDDKVTG
jgi:3-hydroxybutyryl-CoA dehydratase